MNIPSFLLAATSLPGTRLPPSSTSGPFFSPQTRDTMIILIAVFFVAAMAFVFFFAQHRRKLKTNFPKASKTKRMEGERYYRARGSSRQPPEPVSRNPTLAEKGGLPPIKEKFINPSK